MAEGCGRSTAAPTDTNDMTLQVEGLRWQGPDHAVARVPRSWDRGTPGTREIARVAAHCTHSTAF